MGSKLESLMMTWQLDFYGELSAICVALQVGPDSGARDSLDDYAQRFKEWSSAGTSQDLVENVHIDPGLVKDVFVWETSLVPSQRALRFNSVSGKIESSSVPPNLRTLFNRLQSKSSSLSVALRAWQIPEGLGGGTRGRTDVPSPTRWLRTNTIAGWQFDANVPAIVHPVIHRRSLHSALPARREGPVDWIVVVLNLETIQKRILPDLANRYFSTTDGFEYKVAVVATGNPPALLYASDQDLEVRALDSFDSRMNIFGPPPESVEGQFWQSNEISQALRGEEWHSFSAPVWFPLIRYATDEEPWLLYLQHRKGPLEATVTNVFRSNLVTGGVVLLLLATAMVLVVIASQHAQTLANLQMSFVASVSHELRTPLAAILSAGQNIRDGFVPDLHEYGSIITDQACQLIDLVDQILLFSSVRSGKTRYLREPLHISEVLEEVRKNTSTLLDRAGFTLEIRIEPHVPCALGDKQALSRCLYNLIGNATKYSGQSRWIGIFAESGKSSNGATEVRIRVKDRGMGISTAELSQIFEPFYRSPRVVAAQIHGTGLGLSVVKHIVESMEGTISVTSGQGLGSEFTLHFQAARGTALGSSSRITDDAISR